MNKKMDKFHWSGNSLPPINLECSLSCSKEPAIRFYPKPVEFTPHPMPLRFIVIVI
jgi:hypothetical protein